MIKSFVSHLRDTTKTYSFKLRLAVEATSELMDRVEMVLDAYQLESISKPKRLPIQEDAINFPKLGPVEISLVDIQVGYPVISEEIQHLLYERAGIPMTHMCVHTAAQSADREPLPDMVKGEALLNTPLEETEQEDVYGNEYISSFLDSIESRDMPFDADSTDKMATTNELPQGIDSPMTHQNKLPDPMKDF